MEKSLIDKTITKPQDSGEYRDEATFGFERFCGKMINAHNRAVKKHPLTGMDNIERWTEVCEQGLIISRQINDAREKNGNCYSWQGLLVEEVAEAQKEICNGNFTAAQAELAHVAQVAFRAWLWCEEQKRR